MHVHMCAASFVCVQVCMVCMHLHVEVRGHPHMSFLMNVHVGFLRQSLTKNCCSLIRLGCLAGNLRCLPVSASSVWRSQVCVTTTVYCGLALLHKWFSKWIHGNLFTHSMVSHPHLHLQIGLAGNFPLSSFSFIPCSPSSFPTSSPIP